MLLQRIKISRQSQQVLLCFDTGLNLPFPVDQLIHFHLASGQDVAADEFIPIATAAVRYLLLSFSLRQVAISPKTEFLLRFRLRRRLSMILRRYQLNIPPSVGLVDEVISYLDSRRLLNQDDYVVSLLRRHSRHSLLYLRGRLVAAGVNPDRYRHLLLPENDHQALRDLINRRRADLIDPKAKNRLLASLIRKGFAFRDVKSVIDDLPDKS